jgi:hypothetical protein
VAIKVLTAHALLEPRHLGCFQREARSAAKLHHTNIVPVFGVGEQDDLHYYVMHFIQGLGLDVVLNELRRLRPPRGKQPLTLGDSPSRPPNLTRDISALHVTAYHLKGVPVYKGALIDYTTDGTVTWTYSLNDDGTIKQLIGTAHVVHRHDVGVIEIGGGAGLRQVGLGVFQPGHQPAVRHLNGYQPLQLVVVGQVNQTESASAQDSFHSVAADVLRCRSGNFINGSGLERACLVGVVHGQSSSGPGLPD